MFRINQRVVCVDDGTPFLPERGRVYTVRAILSWNFDNGNYVALLLDEIRNPVLDWVGEGRSEHPFWIGRFRPVVERKTDISIFKAMLNPKRHERAMEERS